MAPIAASPSRGCPCRFLLCFILSCLASWSPAVVLAFTGGGKGGGGKAAAAAHSREPTVTLPRPRGTDGALSSAVVAAEGLGVVPSGPRVGVLLLNLGGPETADDVEGFLYNGLQGPIAKIIASRRAPKSTAAYESIGGGSPIVKYTKAQAAGIQAHLQRRGINAKTYVAMRYWHPFTKAALDEIDADNVEAMVVVPLYPQFSVSTSGSSLRELRELFLLDSDRWGCEKRKHTVVPCWYKRPGYVTAVARLIKDEINAYSEEDRLSGKGIHVLFSAHGVPKSYIENGDPYQKQIQECVSLISKEYEQEGVTTHLSYQSRVGPIEWLRPYTDDTIPELGRAGVKNLVVVPISFVSEHIETLEEIDMEYRETALEAGITNWRRVPALNTDEGFLMDMADLCEEALRQPAVSISEACSANNVDLGGGDPVAEAVNNRATQQKLLGLATLSSVALDIFFGKGVSYLFGM